MNKIALIISREYSTRVKKRSFIILTFLVPVLIAAMYGLVGYILLNQNELSSAKKVSVVDESRQFKNKFQNTRTLVFYYSDKKLPDAKESFKTSGFDFILYIPAFTGKDPQGIQLFSDKQANMNTISQLSSKIEDVVKTRKLLSSGIDTARIRESASDVSIETRLLTDSGEKSGNTYAAYGIGFLFAMLTYLFIFLYGAQVMRGVIEEKTSRVIEVIISSVKPFELMMGKIIGIALVGITQFLLWVILSAAVSTVISRAFTSPAAIPTAQAGSSGSGKTVAASNASGAGVSSGTGKASAAGDVRSNSGTGGAGTRNAGYSGSPYPGSAASGGMATPGTMGTPVNEGPLATVMKALKTVNFIFILSCFLFYFVTGYLLYGALFAAVGSAVDSETETQQFMLPITLPLVFAFIISVNYIVNFPDAPLSVWLSLIPFFAPVAMMVRLPFNPPLWQVGLSMVLMIVGFIGTVWIASRVYRVGILMYGKKASFKEMRKWLFYKE